MGVAAYNRGSALIALGCAELMPAANARAERQASKDETERLRERVALLERDLKRARRCIAAERMGRENLRLQLAAEKSAYSFAVGTLCNAVFPEDK